VRRALFVVVALAACATPGQVTWEDVDAPPVASGRAEPPRDPQRDPQRDSQRDPARDPPREPQRDPRRDPPRDPAPDPPLDPRRESPPASPRETPAREPSPVAPVVSAPAANAQGLALFGADVRDGAFVDAPALSLACLADPRALTEPALAFGRLEEEAKKLGATLGEPRVVRLVRDPARSLTDPPPRACRPIVEDAVFKAPLSREAEPASRWLVTTSAGRVPDDASRALSRAGAQKLTTTAPPRVIVDENGAILAIVVPVEGG
jgi:hypothetical protein